MPHPNDFQTTADAQRKLEGCGIYKNVFASSHAATCEKQVYNTKTIFTSTKH